MNILINSPHLVTALGLKQVLSGAFEKSIVDIIESKTVLNENPKLDNVDLIILDTELKTSQIKHDLTIIKGNNPETKVLIFGNKKSQHLEFHFITLGANGFICRDCSKNDLLTAINMITRGNVYISEAAIKNNMVLYQNGMQMNKPNNILSKRELEIFKHLINGLGINQICEEVDLKQATVSTLKKRIFEKYKVSNVIDLYKIAYSFGYQ